MTQPISPRMSIEQQSAWIKTIRDSTMPPHQKQDIINTAILHGTIDPPHITQYRDSLLEFRTLDPDTQRVKEMAATLSARSEPVLVLGESGTGKELLARILHGERRGEFVAVNVCAVAETLFESELFGHIRGAFTGADKDRPGLIAQASGGTLFLDEVGDMPLQLQAKLLRVIQHRQFRKVGSNVYERMDCRVIAATHRDLRNLILTKEFRLDLYERLNVFNLRIRPIRDRMEDMALYICPELASHIVGMDHYKAYTDTSTPRPPEWYSLYPLLSGNVRQLCNLQLRWEVFGTNGITKDDIL